MKTRQEILTVTPMVTVAGVSEIRPHKTFPSLKWEAKLCEVQQSSIKENNIVLKCKSKNFFIK